MRSLGSAMMQASFRAVAVFAAAGPKRARIRRWNMPNQVSVRPTTGPRLRNSTEKRLTTGTVRLLRILPPLILLPGQSPSQEQKALRCASGSCSHQSLR